MTERYRSDCNEYEENYWRFGFFERSNLGWRKLSSSCEQYYLPARFTQLVLSESLHRLSPTLCPALRIIESYAPYDGRGKTRVVHRLNRLHDSLGASLFLMNRSLPFRSVVRRCTLCTGGEAM